MTRPAHPHHLHREHGASTVEYGLLVAGVTATFLVGAIGLQAVSKAVFDQTVTSVEQGNPAPTTP